MPVRLRTKIQGLLRPPPLKPLRHSHSASELCIKKAQRSQGLGADAKLISSATRLQVLVADEPQARTHRRGSKHKAGESTFGEMAVNSVELMTFKPAVVTPAELKSLEPT